MKILCMTMVLYSSGNFVHICQLFAYNCHNFFISYTSYLIYTNLFRFTGHAMILIFIVLNFHICPQLLFSPLILSESPQLNRVETIFSKVNTMSYNTISPFVGMMYSGKCCILPTLDDLVSL